MGKVSNRVLFTGHDRLQDPRQGSLQDPRLLFALLKCRGNLSGCSIQTRRKERRDAKRKPQEKSQESVWRIRGLVSDAVRQQHNCCVDKMSCELTAAASEVCNVIWATVGLPLTVVGSANGATNVLIHSVAGRRTALSLGTLAMTKTMPSSAPATSTAASTCFFLISFIALLSSLLSATLGTRPTTTVGEGIWSIIPCDHAATTPLAAALRSLASLSSTPARAFTVKKEHSGRERKAHKKFFVGQ